MHSLVYCALLSYICPCEKNGQTSIFITSHLLQFSVKTCMPYINIEYFINMHHTCSTIIKFQYNAFAKLGIYLLFKTFHTLAMNYDHLL